MTNDNPRTSYRDTLIDAMRDRPDVFCLDSDTGLFAPDMFGEMRDRYINLGICEQNLIGVAAGLAAAGKQPFVSTMAAFASLRAVETVRNDVARNALPVRIIATHGGLSAAHLGPTHHSLEDLAILRLFPSMTVAVPADTMAVEAFVRQAIDLPGPLYLRLGRDSAPMLEAPVPRLGEAQWLRTGSDVSLLACGPPAIAAALEASAMLGRHGVESSILNVHTIKPLDADAVRRAALTRLVVTVEEHWTGGGLAGAVAELLAREQPTRMVTIGVEDSFVEVVGDHADLLQHTGIQANEITRRVMTILYPLSDITAS